jgi:hypothetical protein
VGIKLFLTITRYEVAQSCNFLEIPNYLEFIWSIKAVNEVEAVIVDCEVAVFITLHRVDFLLLFLKQ